MHQQTVSIIGFGRFGQTLYRLIKDDFARIILYRRLPIESAKFDFGPNVRIARRLPEVFTSDLEGAVHTLFYCTPISTFDQVISQHRPYFKPHHLIIDVLSVKKWPAQVLNRALKGTKTEAILTHPMFGPDSSRHGFAGLPWVMDRFRADEKHFRFWRDYFKSKGLKVIEMTPDEHDRLAANSQGVAHFIGRLLAEFGYRSTPIDTLGAIKLKEIMDQTVNDSWQLFTDLQRFNPYTAKMRLRLGRAYDQLFNLLLPERVRAGYVTFGIQGGRGSFNEAALEDYLIRHRIKKYQVKYLYTTAKVLDYLHRGLIDFGLFAIHNLVGGLVQESIKAIASYKFKIVEEFGIKIRHFLMVKPTVKIEQVKAIMAHPQVFKQCQQTLAQKYPHLDQVSGQGALIDTAQAAKSLSEGKLDDTIAILGPAGLAKLYNLQVVDHDLQDNKDNLTSFLMVTRE